jgi:hypothetical protein
VSTEERGTTLDPKWRFSDNTGGNDSGTSGIQAGELDAPQGEDRTARLLREDHMGAGGAPGPDPSLAPPIELGLRADGEIADESGLGAGLGPEAQGPAESGVRRAA